MWLMGSASASDESVAELTGTDSVQHRTVPDLFPQMPPLQCPNYQNPVIYTQSESKGSNISLCYKMLFMEEIGKSIPWEYTVLLCPYY